LTFKQFNEGLKAGQFAPAYLFSGKEEYLAETGLKALIDKLLTPDERDLNLSVFYGKDADGLLEALASPPIFAARRVIIIRRAQDLNQKLLESVLKWLERPPSDACLILLAGEMDKRKAFDKKLGKFVHHIICGKLKHSDLLNWMTEQVSVWGKKLDDDAAERLAGLDWPGLKELAHALDNLTLMVGDRVTISLADVEEFGGGSFEMEHWKLTQAMGDGDYAGAVAAFMNLQKWDVKPTLIIATLFKTLRQLWLLRYHFDRKSVETVRKAIGLSDWMFSRLLRQAQRRPLKSFEDAILRLEDAELNIKRGARNDTLETSLMINDVMKILGATQTRR